MVWLNKIEPHPTIEGKYQCPHCDYGHDDPKSKQMLYRHFNSTHKESTGSDEGSSPPPSDVSGSISDTDPVDTDSFTEWESIEWLTGGSDENVPHTIPAPIREMANSKAGKSLVRAHKNMERAAVRWGFIGLDRLITWWGRGVMSNKSYELQRSQKDYDVLQESTVGMMDAYGIHIPASPVMVWGTIIGSAYVPPLVHIRKNADPNRRRRMRIPIFGRLFRRRKKKAKEVIENAIELEESVSQ